MFFRAGVLGQMEELRDERLGKIVSWMQAYIRGYLSRKDYKKLQEQRLALQIVQRNLRKYLQLRTWPWWKLWQKIKPLLNVTRIEDEMAVSVSSRYSLRMNRLAQRKLLLRHWVIDQSFSLIKFLQFFVVKIYVRLFNSIFIYFIWPKICWILFILFKKIVIYEIYCKNIYLI